MRKVSIQQLSRYIFCIYIISVFVFSFQSEYVRYSEYIYYLFAVTVFLTLIINDFYVLMDRTIYFLILFAGLACISSLWAINSENTLSSGISLCILVSIVIFVYQVFDIENVDSIIYAIYIAGFIMTFFTIRDMGVEPFFEAIVSGRRISGTMQGANSYGIYMSIAFVCGFHIICKAKWKIFHLALLIVVFSGILASNSRNAIVICLLGGVLYFFIGLSDIKVISKFGMMFLAVAIILLLYDYGLFDGILGRMEGVNFNGNGDDSVNTRMFMIKFGISNFIYRPVLGYGINNAQYLLERYFARTYLHNNYIELLVDMGIVGVILYYLYHVTMLKRLFLYRNSLEEEKRKISLIIVIIFMLLVADISIVFYYNKLTYVVFAMAAVALKSDNNVGTKNNDRGEKGNGKISKKNSSFGWKWFHRKKYM